MVQYCYFSILYTEQKAEVHEGMVTRGLVTCVRPETGLVLQLADGIRGTVDLTDLSSSYTNNPTSKFKVGSVIAGHVQELNIMKQRAVISLRSQE